MKNTKTLFLVRAAMIAAIYVVLTIVFIPISFSEIQVRIAEALTILPLFTPAAIPGLFVGCLLGNILGGAPLPDIIFGSLATLIGAIGTYMLRPLVIHGSDRNPEKKEGFRPLLGAVPPIVSNTILIPFVLRYAYGLQLPIPLMMLTVGLGEVISCGWLGFLLYKVLRGRAENLF